jgi:hypothetical protein
MKPMNCFRALSIASFGVACLGCSSSDDAKEPEPPSSATAALDLAAVKTNPDDYTWFDFRPNVKKLILAGAAETEHIAILWYTVPDGAVGLHYHGKTESVYVIEGTQTDAKGTYPTGTVYFNPPGSGHQISDSSGFFLLAYSAPPDFMSTDLIEEYEPVRIDTEDPEMTTAYPFEESATGIETFLAPLVDGGGLSAEFVQISESDAEYDFDGNYLLVLEGSCTIDGETYDEDMLVVTKDVAPEPFVVAASEEESCLALGVSF